MADLPEDGELSGDLVTQGGFKTAIGNLRQFLEDNFGLINSKADVRSTLGIDDNFIDKTTDQDIAGIKNFTSSPTVPTLSSGDNSTKVATTAYVDTAISAAIDGVTLGAYGLTWDETNDTYTRTGASDTTQVQVLMKRCVLNADTSVNYYLDASDSTLQADGVTPSVLDGTDGNVMVEIPKFYYKYEYTNNSSIVSHAHSISLEELDGYVVHPAFVINGVEKDYRYFPAYEGSYVGSVLMSVSGVYPQTSQTRAQFRAAATLNGAGWHQLDFLLYEAVTLLMIIEFGTMNIQEALGQGRTALSDGDWTNGSYIGITGLSNSLGNSSGNYTYSGDADNAEADLSFMSYRGCENFFGNVWWIVDGINISSHVPYISQNPDSYADDVFTGDYVSTGITMGSTIGYARNLGNSGQGFFPTSVTSGTSATGTTDYYYPATGNRVVVVGGNTNNGLVAGPLYLLVAYDSAFSYVGASTGVSA